jgi:hypothetical protein
LPSVFGRALLHGFGRDRGNVDLFELERELAGLDLGDEEEVAHDVQQPAAVPLDDLQEPALLVGQVPG